MPGTQRDVSQPPLTKYNGANRLLLCSRKMGMVRSGTTLSWQHSPRQHPQNPLRESTGKKEVYSCLTPQPMYLEKRLSNVVWPFLHYSLYARNLNFSMGWTNKEPYQRELWKIFLPGPTFCANYFDADLTKYQCSISGIKTEPVVTKHIQEGAELF